MSNIYRRHIFADLRPYVCISDGCEVNHIDFTSRGEFAAHLTEHQQTKLWACTQCGHTEESKDIVIDHIKFKHSNEDQKIDIIEKSIHRDLPSEKCPFCSEVPGAAKFVGHICHHLEEVSLSAIPRPAEEDEDDGASEFSIDNKTEFNIGGIPISRIQNNEVVSDVGRGPWDVLDEAKSYSPRELYTSILYKSKLTRCGSHQYARGETLV